MQPAMLLSNLTTLLLPFFFLLILIPFPTNAAPQEGPFYTATTPQGKQYKVGVLPGYHLPTDSNGQILNRLDCQENEERTTPIFKRRHMIIAADGLCSQMHGRIIPNVNTGNAAVERRISAYSSFPVEQVWLVAQMAVAEGAVWMVDKSVCRELFRRIIDECDTHGEDVKIGGTLEASGVRFFLGGGGFDDGDGE